MIRDLLHDTTADGDQADVCIVGAGAAGIVLAVELARQGKRVLLLEGGGPDVEGESQDPYRSEIVGLRHEGVNSGRFRAAGGTTTRWGGQILELDAWDFEARSWIPGSGWPFPKQHLQPFYDRAIVLEGLGSATLFDADVWAGIGVTPRTFQHLELFFTRWCPETNFARLHHRTLAEDPNISVWLHCNAVGMVMEGDRVREVRCKTLTGVERTFAANDFVWSMGGIESSRFFLQPEFEAMPWRRNGLLGKFFQDHVTAPVASIEPVQASAFHDTFDNVFSRRFKYQPKLRLEAAQQQHLELLNAGAYIAFASDTDAELAVMKDTLKKLARLSVREISGSDIANLLRNVPSFVEQSWAYFVRHRAYIPKHATVKLVVSAEQSPESASSITLADTRDRLGMLRTRLDWQVSDVELRTMRTFVELAAMSLRDIARVTPDRDILESPERFREKCGDLNHHMGGMRMALSPDHGIVTPDLRVHGVQNAYVCSGAVFPSSGFSNPTHTVLALAVRLADHLAAQKA